jgi:hypothetical protein
MQDEKLPLADEKKPFQKKPYRRPEILYREKLEAMAALCVPSPPAKQNPGMCPSGPIAS